MVYCLSTQSEPSTSREDTKGRQGHDVPSLVGRSRPFSEVLGGEILSGACMSRCIYTSFIYEGWLFCSSDL